MFDSLTKQFGYVGVALTNNTGTKSPFMHMLGILFATIHDPSACARDTSTSSPVSHANNGPFTVYLTDCWVGLHSAQGLGRWARHRYPQMGGIGQYKHLRISDGAAASTSGF